MTFSQRMVIALTFLVALVAAIMPLPLSVDEFRPDWVLVVLLYWAMAAPSRVNIGIAWLIGLVLDILLGSTLGVHGGAIAISTFIVVGSYQKIRNFSVWQQALIIGTLSALYHLTVFWIQYFLTDAVFVINFLYPVVSTVLLWPWAFLLLRKIRRHFQIK